MIIINKLNESKSYTISANDYLSGSDLKKMKVGSTISSNGKYATKVGPDSWDLNDRIDTIKGISSFKLSNIFDDEEIEVNEK